MHIRGVLVLGVLLAMTSCSDSSSSNDTVDSGTSSPGATSPASSAEPPATADATSDDRPTATGVPSSPPAVTNDPSGSDVPPSGPVAEPDELIAVVEELEEAVEAGDTETALRLGGEAAEARAWARKVDVVVDGRGVAAIDVSGDLTVLSDDGTEVITEGEYSVTHGQNDNVVVAADPVFQREDGELALASSTPVQSDDDADSEFAVRTLPGEPVDADGTTIGVRTILFEQPSPNPGSSSARFALSFEGDAVRAPLSALWVDGSGVERIAAPVEVAADDESGITVGGITFSEALNASILDELGTLTFAYEDGTTVEVPLPAMPELDDLQSSAATQLLAPPPVPDPTLDADAAATEIAGVLTDYADAYVRCTAHPGACDATAATLGREVRSSLLASANSLAAENQRMLFFPGAVTARIDDLRVHDSGLFAAADVCTHDGSILIDLGADRVATEDDVVVDDAAASFRELYTFDAAPAGWRVTNRVPVEQYGSPEECLAADGDDPVVFVDDFVATGGPGLNGIGEVESAEELANFFEQTVIADEGELRTRDVLQAFSAEYPSLLVRMQAVKASPSAVSLIVGQLDKDQEPSATNPLVAVGTFLDTSGRCLGRVVYGFPDPSAAITVSPSADQDCSAADILENASSAIAASPPTATTAAP